MTLLEFYWLDDGAAAGDVGAVMHDFDDEGEEGRMRRRDEEGG
jgi:hypothetical protein